MAKYIHRVHVPYTPTPPPALQILTTSFPSGITDTLYPDTALQAAGGVAPYTWTLVSPNNVLPTGMNLTSGVIGGTPTIDGTFPLVIRCTDSAATVVYTGIINLQVAYLTTLTVTTTNLLAANRGVPYSQQLVAINNNGSVTWSLEAPNNVLPTGLSLVGDTIQGTPTVFETLNVNARATDTITYDLSGLMPLIVNQVADLAITSTTLPQGEINTAYTTYTFNTSGGYGTKTWAIISGAIPAGMSFNTSTGELSGTPTGSAATAVFTLEAEDSEARVATKDFTLQVVAEGTVEGPNDYFTDLIGLTEHHASVSYRDQDEIDDRTPTKGRPNAQVTYDYAGDTAPNKQDAAKVFLDANVGQLTNFHAVTFSFSPHISSGSIILVYDVYLDTSWRIGMDAAPDMRGNKSVRVHKQGGTGGGGWAHMWDYTGDRLGITNVLTHDEIGIYGGYAAGVISQENFQPAGSNTVSQTGPETYYQYFPNIWHRVIFEMKYLQAPAAFTDWNARYGVTVASNPREPGGEWHMLSKWVMRENEGSPTRQIYKCPVQTRSVTDFSKPPFYFVDATIEFDTSQRGTGALPKWCYYRNFVLLKDYVLPTVPEDDTFLFRAPLRTL